MIQNSRKQNNNDTLTAMDILTAMSVIVDPLAGEIHYFLVNVTLLNTLFHLSCVLHGCHGVRSIPPSFPRIANKLILSVLRMETEAYGNRNMYQPRNDCKESFLLASAILIQTICFVRCA